MLLHLIKSIIKKASYTLGEPFKIYKFNKKSDGNYYFPVLNTEGNIDYIVTISPKITKYSSSSSKYTINVSPFLSKVLNQYKDQQITILTNSKVTMWLLKIIKLN